MYDPSKNIKRCVLVKMPEIRTIVPDSMDAALDSLIRAGFAGNKAELVRSAILQFVSSLPTSISKNYDLESVFSPDGRILQVEYADQAVRRGITTIGLCVNEGIALFKRIPSTYSPIAPLLAPNSQFRPIRSILPSLEMAYTGISSDAYSVVREAMKKISGKESQKINISMFVENLSLYLHTHTLQKNLRVLGASFIIGGLDLEDNFCLFVLDPSGTIFPTNAVVRGLGQNEITAILTTEYRGNMSLEDAVRLGLETILQGKDGPENVIVDIIDKKSKIFRELTAEEKSANLN